MQIKWTLKQLLPLRYQSEYWEGENKDRKYLTIWRMWFGKSYRVRSWELAK